MPKKSIRDKIRDEIIKAVKEESDKLKKEKDEVKQTKIVHKMLQIEQKIILENIKKLSDSDFQDMMEELGEEIMPSIKEFSKKEEKIVFRNAKEPQEFTKFKKIKKLQELHEQKLIEIISDSNLNKRGLERYLLLILTVIGQLTHQARMNELENLEFYQALDIVQNRLGFDKNWLIGMSLIQLHENLLKKKLSQLGEKIHPDQKMPQIISRLINSIKQKENRDVRLSIEMSTGLKKIRDIVTHQGYKQKITKPDLENIIKEIKKVEEVLYPIKKEINQK